MADGDISQVLRTIAHVLDHREQNGLPHNSEQRRLALVQRLLEGESPDTSLLNYTFDGFHLGVVATGPHSAAELRDLRGRLNSRLLVVEADEETAWAWLGAGRRPLQADLAFLLSRPWPAGTAIACGEPAESLDGWRLTHRQAVAALPIAQHSLTAVHYPDVALLATALHDDLLSASLRHAYLDPLEEDRDGGLAAKDTLRAYFKASRNASSAAADLGVNRATIRNRLAAIEDRLGRSPDTASAELEVALRLDELTNRDSSVQEVATW